ncbi:interleukin-31 receptor subunit alpha-like [Salarias fasciatus]|uniref:interleukin-31 receptor subunit alpha-like n=1 Tax=Salarias fasciatus TaxID=181472 RepID=UPI001176648B|nr:interleukin-31 receptor subunit alpha-like [Salarias fasciatus]
MDLLPLFFMLVLISVCKGQHHDSCVQPKDQYIQAGSSTEVVCKTSCVHGGIFWKINSKPVHEGWSQTINSTHAVLSLRNLTLPSATVECRSVETQQIVGGVIIKTYKKPGNISCVFHYDSESSVGVPELLTCTWEHQTPPREKVNYTVLTSAVSHTSPIEVCKTKVTNCTVRDFYTSERIGIYVGDNFTVTVRAKGQAWEVHSDSYEFNLDQILKINPPKFSVATSSDHILVEWTRQRTTPKHRCQVKYRKAPSADERTPVWMSNKTLITELNVTIRIEEKLESCTEYRVSVRCGLGEAPWSDWSREKTVLTKLNKSQIRLRLWRKVTEVRSDGVRRVCAMWTAIPAACPGRFTYEINQISLDQEHAVQGSQIYTSRGNSTCDVTVNRDARRINLTVFRDEVPLAEDSVYVPAVGESLPQVTDIQTSARDGVILVNWKAPNQSVSGYMIDWTHDGNQYFWEETKHTNASLFGLLDKEPYNITVTPLFDDKAGHGTQAQPTCSGVGDPGTVVITGGQASDRTADVSWETQSEGPCSAAFVSYTVFYRTQDGPLLNMTVDSKKQKVVLKDLEPDTLYRVYVEATALTGVTRSINERVVKTNKFDPNFITVLTVCGCVLILLVLFLGLCCAVQWKRFRDKPVPNPGLSSVASWSLSAQQKSMCLFQPFSNPCESTFDKVYTEQTPDSSTPSLTTISSNSNTTSDETRKYDDSALGQSNKPPDPIMTQHPRFSEETAAFLPSESSPGSPYRSQTSVGTQKTKTDKPWKHVPGKEQEKVPAKTVYVTLDMFEHDQAQ